MPGDGTFECEQRSMFTWLPSCSNTAWRLRRNRSEERTVTGPGPGSWQPDPEGRYEYRWWDGQNWSDQVSHQGRVGAAPLSGAPTQGADPGPAAHHPAHD